MIRTATLSACRALGAASARAPVAAAPRAAPSLCKTLSTSTEPAEEIAMRWRFPADERTQNMLVSVEHGLNQTARLTLNSTAPVTPDLMEEALTHAYNKIESLRLCLRSRHGQLWLADMPQRKLDFQVLSETDLDEQHLALDKSPYNVHDGPLWKVWLMPCHADAPCPMPEVKSAFPHQCHLLMSLHHAFNDGVVVLTLTEVLLRILDSLLEGSPVDNRPVGELRDSVEIREEEKRIRTELESDPGRLLEALSKHTMSKHLPILMEAYGVPTEADPATKYIQPVLLDTQMVEKFAAKCRSIGATMNAGFIAALNVSIMELAREAGLKRDVYNISSRLPVDCRRLMKDCKILPLGFHSMPFTQCTATPRDAKKHFWQYVKHLDTELRHKLKRNYTCEERVLEALMRPEGFTYEEAYASRQLPNVDYLFSNMYSPKTTLQKGVGKNIQITAGGNYMTLHSENCAFPQGVFSSRGQARLQIGYCTNALTRRVAERCLENNVAVLHDASKLVN